MWFGYIGGAIYILAIVATVLLAVLARRNHATLTLVTVAAAIEVLALIVFLPWSTR